MPNRATALLLAFLVAALLCFGGGLYALRSVGDLLATLLFAAGAMALRALSQAAKIVEGGHR